MQIGVMDNYTPGFDINLRHRPRTRSHPRNIHNHNRYHRHPRLTCWGSHHRYDEPYPQGHMVPLGCWNTRRPFAPDRYDGSSAVPTALEVSTSAVEAFGHHQKGYLPYCRELIMKYYDIYSGEIHTSWSDPIMII